MKSVLLDKKIDFFLKCLNISERQFENLIRFHVLMFQITDEIFNPNIINDDMLDKILEVNESYFFEKMKHYFNFQKNDIPIEKRVDDLIGLNFFEKDYFSLIRNENFMNGHFIDKKDDYKAYVIYVFIIKDLCIVDKKRSISFKILNHILEKLFCPIQNTTSTEYLRIHTLLEEHVSKISKKVLLNI